MSEVLGHSTVRRLGVEDVVKRVALTYIEYTMNYYTCNELSLAVCSSKTLLSFPEFARDTMKTRSSLFGMDRTTPHSVITTLAGDSLSSSFRSRSTTTDDISPLPRPERGWDQGDEKLRWRSVE